MTEPNHLKVLRLNHEMLQSRVVEARKSYNRALKSHNRIIEQTDAINKFWFWAVTVVAVLSLWCM